MTMGSGDREPDREDEIDRKLRELTEGLMGEAQLKEPSADERAKRAAQDRKRAKRGERKQRRQGRGVRLKLGTVALVVLAAVGGLTWLRFSGSPARGPSGQPQLGASLPGGAPPADPFATTPAEKWANGELGIVVPAAKPVGNFTAAQVTRAYQTTRRLLIAAHLDRQTLLGGVPTAFANLLTKQQRSDFLGGLNKKGVDKGGEAVSTRKWVTSFFPGSAEFIGNVIKVHGVMSAHTAHEAGGTVLAIQVNYLFDYAVEPPGDQGDWMRVLAHNFGSFDFAQWDDPGGPLEPWDQTVNGSAGGQCGVADGYIHPDYPSERTNGPTSSGPAINPYSSATSVPGGGAACGRTTGT